MSNLPVYSALEIVQEHIKCLRSESPESHKQSMLDLFDPNKSKIALVTLQEKEDRPEDYKSLSTQRAALLQHIEMLWRELE